jgi:hypothetical protein
LNSGTDEILADYNEAELELLVGFLQKITAAGVIVVFHIRTFKIDVDG